MTFHFEFYRHTCGRTISIHDAEPCVCEQETEIMERVSIPMKALRRLLRRAKAHGQTPWFVINNGYPPYAVLFAGRHIRISEDGSYTADIAIRHTADGQRRADPHWLSGNTNRWHAFNMKHAAWCRKNRMIQSGRFAVRVATQERLRVMND